MSYTKQEEQTIIKEKENKKKVYITKKFLRFVPFRVLQKTDSLGKDLVIETKEEYNNIYLNGKKLK